MRGLELIFDHSGWSTSAKAGNFCAFVPGVGCWIGERREVLRGWVLAPSGTQMAANISVRGGAWSVC